MAASVISCIRRPEEGTACPTRTADGAGRPALSQRALSEQERRTYMFCLTESAETREVSAG